MKEIAKVKRTTVATEVRQWEQLMPTEKAVVEADNVQWTMTCPMTRHRLAPPRKEAIETCVEKEIHRNDPVTVMYASVATIAGKNLSIQRRRSKVTNLENEDGDRRPHRVMLVVSKHKSPVAVNQERSAARVGSDAMIRAPARRIEIRAAVAVVEVAAGICVVAAKRPRAKSLRIDTARSEMSALALTTIHPIIMHTSRNNGAVSLRARKSSSPLTNRNKTWPKKRLVTIYSIS
jgi:hypothetical protein